MSSSSIHLKSYPSRSRLPELELEALLLVVLGRAGLGMGSRSTTWPRKTPPSFRVSFTSG
jgi:hypothetical protein